MNRSVISTSSLVAFAAVADICTDLNFNPSANPTGIIGSLKPVFTLYSTSSTKILVFGAVSTFLTGAIILNGILAKEALIATGFGFTFPIKTVLLLLL